MSLLSELLKVANRPAIYEKGNIKLWEDAHISKGMLEAHLSPDDDAATRKHSFIDASVDWITSILPPEKYPKLIDLGCGPGMYTSRLYSKGYEVTGVDISSRSIDYAKSTSNDKAIEYRVLNYLELDEQENYDVALLIYCDYGALSDVERHQILKNAYAALKPGGKMIFDAFTPKQYKNDSESKSWTIHETGSFFKEDAHIFLYSHVIYSDSVRLDQYVLIDKEDQMGVINVWDTVFTFETLKAEVESVGFKIVEHFSDVAGKSYDEESETICVVLEKVV